MVKLKQEYICSTKKIWLLHFSLSEYQLFIVFVMLTWSDNVLRKIYLNKNVSQTRMQESLLGSFYFPEAITWKEFHRQKKSGFLTWRTLTNFRSLYKRVADQTRERLEKNQWPGHIYSLFCIFLFLLYLVSQSEL